MRQALEYVDSSLRGGTLIFSLPLRRDFARKPAYWVEIYRTNVPNTKYVRYDVAKQWGFYKKDTKETVQDSTVIRAASFTAALSMMKGIAATKMNSGWIIVDDTVDAPVLSPTIEESVAIAAYMTNWLEGHEEKEQVEVIKKSLKKEELPRPLKFKEAQRKRKAKAEW